MTTGVKQILQAAEGFANEHRSTGRQPFFHPTSMYLPSQPLRRYSAFTRDVSEQGIGLLHAMPLEPGRITLETYLGEGKCIKNRVEITWCLPCGDGWFISGGAFVV
ncbi:MAG: hypothetical protein R3E01_26590 [Pirellulaceae bacterium]